jgi:hypothetical protein
MTLRMRVPPKPGLAMATPDNSPVNGGAKKARNTKFFLSSTACGGGVREADGGGSAFPFEMLTPTY